MDLSGTKVIESGKQSACSAGNPGMIPGQEEALKKEMTTHSSILAWRIPWTKRPGRLQSMIPYLDITERLTLLLSKSY